MHIYLYGYSFSGIHDVYAANGDAIYNNNNNMRNDRERNK